jgi:hypothetical protein
VGEIRNTEETNEFFENVAEFRWLGTTLRKVKYCHEEMKSRLNMRKTCYLSAQNL